MKNVTNGFLIVVIFFLGMYCNNAKQEKTNVIPGVKELKVTATNEDLCRIVLSQQLFADTSISRDKKVVAMTLLSDGSGQQILYEESEIRKLYKDFGYPTKYLLSGDCNTVLYDMSFFFGNNYVRDNIFVCKVDTRRRDSLFCEESTYTHDRFSMFIETFKLNPAGNTLIVSTNEFIRCLNLKTGQYFDIKAQVPFGLQWINNTSFYYNRGYNKKWECRRYDITTKKSESFLVNDTLPLENVSATINGERLLKYVYVDSDSAKLGDSLYFFTTDFKPVSKSFVANAKLIQYIIALSGKWIYYTDERALRRVRVEDVEGITQTIDNMNAKAQVIYPFPILTEGNDISDIASGMITQLLPVEKGEK